MSRTYKDAGNKGRRERKLSVRAVRREPPDLRKLSRALIALALAEAEAEEQAKAAQDQQDAGPTTNESSDASRSPKDTDGR